jgi:hypothetical protein
MRVCHTWQQALSAAECTDAPSDVSTTPTLGCDARSCPPTHSPQSAPEGRRNHQGRSIEASLCDPRPYASLSRLAASAERSGAHRCLFTSDVSTAAVAGPALVRHGRRSTTSRQTSRHTRARPLMKRDAAPSSSEGQSHSRSALQRSADTLLAETVSERLLCMRPLPSVSSAVTGQSAAAVAHGGGVGHHTGP